jgi:hypothetical protein
VLECCGAAQKYLGAAVIKRATGARLFNGIGDAVTRAALMTFCLGLVHSYKEWMNVDVKKRKGSGKRTRDETQQ